MSIRKATQNDCQGIWRVHTRAITEVCASEYSTDDIGAWVGLLSPESYREVLSSRIMFVAEQNSAVVGFCQLDLEEGEVEAVYVLADRLHMGIGRSLLKALEDVARSSELSALQLSSTLNAVAFYEAMGYSQLEPVEHVLPNGIVLRCIRMNKEITSPERPNV